MAVRPRTPRAKRLKEIRCPKCQALLRSHDRRCKRCHRPAGQKS